MSKWSPKTMQLIQSLNRSELRYCRLMLEQRPEKRDPSWLALFNELVHLSTSGTEPDPDNLIREIQAISSRKQLSQTTSELRQQLLAALRHYYSGSLAENSLLQKIEEINILVRKGQYLLADQILKSAMKTGSELSWNPYWPKLAQLEAFLSRQRFGSDELENHLHDLSEASQKQSKIIDNTVQFNLLATKLFGIIGRGSESEEERSQLLELERHELLRAPPDNQPRSAYMEEQSLESKMRYHEIRGTLQFHKENFRESIRERSALVQIFSADPRRISREPVRYVVILNNLIISTMRQNDYSEVKKWLDVMRSFPENHKLKNQENIEAIAFSNSYSNEIYYLINNQMFDRLRDIIPEIEKGMDHFQQRISNEYIIDFDYQISRAWFEMREYEKCLIALQPVLNNWPAGFRTNQQIQGRILNLLTHFQLGNYKVLDSMLLNFRRFAVQTKHRSPVTSALLRLLKGINYQPDSEIVRRKIGNFRMDMQEKPLPEGQQLLLLESGIKSWMNSWIQVEESI